MASLWQTVQKAESSGRPLLPHRLHVSAARTVKYVEVRQLLKVLNVPDELHRRTAVRACRRSGLVSVAHGETLLWRQG